MGAITAARVPVERASPADLMQFAADVGPAPMPVGAVLILGGGPGFCAASGRASPNWAPPARRAGALRALLASRIEGAVRQERQAQPNYRFRAFHWLICWHSGDREYRRSSF